MAKTAIKTQNNEPSVERLSPNHFLTPFEEMERWADELFPHSWFRSHPMGWPSRSMSGSRIEDRMPRIDIINRDDELYIKAELPGTQKDDIDVSMNGNVITIKSSSRKEQKEEKGDYYRREISQSAFSRSLPLPAEVNIDKSTAKFKDGVLELTLPKIEAAKRRNIKVSG